MILDKTQCNIEFTYASHCVSKNLTNRRMLKKGLLIAKINHKNPLSAKCLKDNKRSCWQTLTRWKCLLSSQKKKKLPLVGGESWSLYYPFFCRLQVCAPNILPPIMKICQKISTGWRRQDWYRRVQTTFQQEVKVILQKLSFSVLILFLQKWSGENTRSRKHKNIWKEMFL